MCSWASALLRAVTKVVLCPVLRCCTPSMDDDDVEPTALLYAESHTAEELKAFFADDDHSADRCCTPAAAGNVTFKGKEEQHTAPGGGIKAVPCGIKADQPLPLLPRQGSMEALTATHVCNDSNWQTERCKTFSCNIEEFQQDDDILPAVYTSSDMRSVSTSSSRLDSGASCIEHSSELHTQVVPISPVTVPKAVVDKLALLPTSVELHAAMYNGTPANTSGFSQVAPLPTDSNDEPPTAGSAAHSIGSCVNSGCPAWATQISVPDTQLAELALEAAQQSADQQDQQITASMLPWMVKKYSSRLTLAGRMHQLGKPGSVLQRSAYGPIQPLGRASMNVVVTTTDTRGRKYVFKGARYDPSDPERTLKHWRGLVREMEVAEQLQGAQYIALPVGVLPPSSQPQCTEEQPFMMGALVLPRALCDLSDFQDPNRRQELHFLRVACIALQICRGLQEMHDRGWVHGDMKPDNVLLWDYIQVQGCAAPYYIPQAKVADVGGAQPTDHQGWLAPHVFPAHTLNYAAPEIAGHHGFYTENWDDNVPRIGWPADVYTLGLMLLELLMFEESHQRYVGVSEELKAEAAAQGLSNDAVSSDDVQMRIADQARGGTLDRPLLLKAAAAAADAALPEQLWELVCGCMEYWPGCRPAMWQVAQELESFIESQGGAACLQHC